MPEQSCQNLRHELQEIKTLKEQFDVAIEESVRTGSPETALALKVQLEEKSKALREKLWPFEQLPRLELQSQYEDLVTALVSTGVVEPLPDGSIGIRGIDGQNYPLPEFESVTNALRESKERLENKIEQGFIKLLLVPFGQSLDHLSTRYEDTILSHHRAGKLFSTKKDSSEADQPLELNEDDSLWRWDQYNNADVSGQLVYYPKKFDSSHEGKTKSDLLLQENRSQTPGWRILLIEDLPNIPRHGKGETIAGRPQIEANKTPNEYLSDLNGAPVYSGESGMTPEDWLAYAITNLETTNQVIDDYQGNGSIAYLTGAYFKTAGIVPAGYWYRGDRRARLNVYDPGVRRESFGARSAVRVT